MAQGIVPLLSDPDFYIFCKPAGTSFHSEAGPGYFTEIQRSFPSEKLFPVHRLDKCTSGLLIVARNKPAASELTNLFASGNIRKLYLALTDKKPAKKQGTISGDMLRSRNGTWKLSRTESNPAITRFISYPVKHGIRVFFLKPSTGKTHQLRVAMKALGSPIIGDIQYGGTPSDRVYLHATQLRFRWNNQEINVRNLPVDGELFIDAGAVFFHLLEASGE